MKRDDTNNGESQNGNDVNGDDDRAPQQRRIPFIIQRIGRGNSEEIEEITRMCIDVFFNEQDDIVVNGNANNNDGAGEATNNNGKKKKRVAPWKALQLAYLRNFQTGDILARNAFKKDQHLDLIVARRVIPVGGDATKINGNGADDGVVVVDGDDTIFNADMLSTNDNGVYTTGEIVGYCEVSEKLFGLGGNFATTKTTTTTMTTPERRKKGGRPSSSGDKRRPYLGNLSVVEYARRSGVGSALLDACEETVRDWGGIGDTNDDRFGEIVLQVEEDNTNAIQFYKRRGWEFVFADPTCRRYDTSGFLLRETRITKYAMIKRLNDGSNGEEGASESGSSFIEKLKTSFFVQ